MNFLVGNQTRRVVDAAIPRFAKLYLICKDGVKYLLGNCDRLLFGSAMRDLDEVDKDGQTLFMQLQDTSGKCYSRLLNFVHVVQQEALEDMV